MLNGDWVQAVLDQPLVADPGTHHQYSTGDTHLLSAVLSAATGMSAKDYAIRKLLAPMNVTLYGWDRDPQGIYQGGNNLSLIPLDFAKIGQLYLDGGRYRGRQIVPAAWVQTSTRVSRIGRHEVYGTYGFLWYLRPGGNEAFVAVGYGGQYLYVAPAQNAVIVVTATLESKGKKWERELFRNIQGGILGSLQTDPRQLVQAADLSVGTLSPSDEPAPPVQVRTGRTRARLNLRRGPGRTYRVIKTLDPGTVLEIKEARDKWLKVEAGELSGWVSGDYVRIVPSDAMTVARQAKEAAPEKEKAPAPTQPAVEKAVSPDMPVSPPGAVVAKAERADEAAQAAQQALTAELTAARERIEALTRALEAAESDKKDVKAGLAPLARELQAQQALLQQSATDRQQMGQGLAALGSELRQLEQTLREQKSQNEALLSQWTQTEKELKSQRERTAQSDEARDTLASELAAMQGRIVSMGDELGAVLNERAALKTELSALRKTLAAERDTRAQAKEAKGTLEDQLKTAREELRALRQDWQQTVDETAKTRAQLGQELTGLRTQLAGMEKTLSEQKGVSAKLAAVSNDVKEQGKKADSLAGEREQLQKELRSLREELASQRAASTQSQGFHQEMQASLSKLAGELESQRQIAGSLETARQELVSELASAREEIQGLRTARQERVAEAAQAQAQLGQEIASLRTQLAEMDDALHDQQGLSVTLAKVTEELETQRRTAQSFQTARESFAAELSGVQAENIELGTALQSAQVDRSTLKAEIRSLRESRQAADEASADAQQALKQEVASLKGQLAEMKKGFGDQQGMTAELASAKSELKALRESRQAADEASARAQQELSQEVTSLRAQLAEMKKDLGNHQGLAAQVADLTVAFKNQQGNVAAFAGTRETLSAELTSAKRELKALRESRQVADEASARAQQALSQEVTSLKAQLAEMKKGFGDQQGMTTELASAKSELKALRESRQAADEASVRAQQALSEELTSLRAQLAEMEKSLGERQELAGKLAGVAEELATQRRIAASFETVRDTLLSDLVGARKEIRSLQDSRHEALAKSADVQDRLGQELTAVREQLQVMEEAFDQQQSDRQAFHKELARVAQELENQRVAAGESETASRELMVELAQVRDQNTLLADTLKAVQGRRDDLKRELVALHRELATQREAAERLQVAALPGKPSDASAEETVRSLQTMLQGKTSSTPRSEVLASAAPTAASEQRSVQKVEPVAAPPSAAPTRVASIPTAPVLPETVTVATTADKPDLSVIDSFVHSWAANWAAQNLEAYLSHYSKTFQPPGRSSLKSWYIQRERRLLKPSFIEIIIGNIRKDQVGDVRARATFEQEYRSDGYGDRVVKTLDLIWENGKWGIVKESSRPL